MITDSQGVVPKITLKIIRGQLCYVIAGVAYTSMKRAMCELMAVQS